MDTPILVAGAAGRVGGVGRTVTELLLTKGKPVRAMVRKEDECAQAPMSVQEFARENAATFTASAKAA